ncbi:MAG: YbjQ family protein [Planctomycetota bacterium]|jgi:uncharacterized protein YbjQ (UPF0145 family)
MKTLRQIGSLAFVVGLFVSVFAGVPWHVLVADDPVVPWWLRAAVFCLLGGILVVLATVALEQRLAACKRGPAAQAKGPAAEAEGPAAAPEAAGEAGDGMLVFNTDSVPGRAVTESLGLVQGHTVFAIWLGKDLSALVRLIVGGELTEYTDMMGIARTTALNRMKTQAAALGADAVINVRYMTTSVVGTASELLAYGTAVKLSNG